MSFHTCSHVFVRSDGHCSLLVCPYHRLYIVLERSDKTFTLGLAGRVDIFTIDRLKPTFCHVDSNVCICSNVWPDYSSTLPSH